MNSPDGPSAPASAAAPIDLMAEVDALVATHWPFFQGRLRAPETDYAIPFSLLAATAGLEPHLRSFASHYPNQDVRGVASLWSQWYAVTVWPPLLGAIVVLGAHPDVDPHRTDLILDEAGKPEALGVPRFAPTGDPTHALEQLARTQAAPLLESLARAAGVAPRVVWSNVANVLGWFLDELEPVAEASALLPARRLLQRPRWDDGLRNPLYVPTALAGPPRAERRVCCLRYRLDDFGYCTDCPITRGGSAATSATRRTEPSW